MQPTTFGARDHSYFSVIFCSAPWRRLNGNPFGVSLLSPHTRICPALPHAVHYYPRIPAVVLSSVVALLLNMRA